MPVIEKFQAYCDICKKGSEWFKSYESACMWRETHFACSHPKNPLKKANCRIKRQKNVVKGSEINSKAEEIIDE